MKYTVTMVIKGEIELEVEADNFDDAFEQAYNRVDVDIDFNQLDCIAMDLSAATDESGETRHFND